MDKSKHENEVSFKNFFVPLTTAKAIFWIVIIGFIVFFNSLFNGFVWDDIGQIVNNTDVHSLSNIGTFFFSQNDINGHLIKIHAIYYRPLMATAFTVAYSLFGTSAFFYHFVSLLFHLIITLLIYFLFRRFFSQTISLFLAVIFLVHPLNSEAVDYISAYNDLLYMFFGMLGLLLIQGKSLSIKRVVAVGICIFLALLAKEPGFLFIPLLLLYSYLFLKKSFFRLVITCIILVSSYVLLRTSFYTGISQDQILGFSPYLHMSFWQHLVNVPKLWLYYIGNFIFPNQLAIAQHWSVVSLSLTDFYLPLIILLLFVVANIYLLFKSFRKKEYLHIVILFTVWFWLGIGLYLQFIPLDMTVADRWFYFPMIGLLGLIGVCFQIFRLRKSSIKVVFSLAIISLILLASRTMVRNTNWNNEFTLYTHDLQGNKSFDLENQLGNVYFQQNNFSEAKKHYERSITLWSCSDAHNNLGYLEQKVGDRTDAENDFIKSVQCSGEYKDYGNLVILLYNERKYNLAELYTKEAIQKFPNGPGLYFVLGLAQYQKGDKADALKSLAIGYRLSSDPQIANAYLLMEQNKPIEFSL